MLYNPFWKIWGNKSIFVSKTIEPNVSKIIELNRSETIEEITNNKIEQIMSKIVDVSKNIE